MKSFARWGLSLVLLLAVGGLAVHQGPVVAKTLACIDGNLAVEGLVAFWSGHLLRSVRLRHLAGGGMPYWPTAVSANALHAVAVYVLPLQAGELALPGILRWASGRRLAEGTGILVRSRLLDVSGMGAWIVAAAAILPAGRMAGAVRLGCLGAGLGFALVPWLFRGLGRLTRAAPSRIRRALLAAEGASRPRALDVCLSVAIWGLSGSCVWACARAVGLPISFWEVWLLMALQLPLQFLPVQGFANAGSHELSWVGGLAVLGYPGDEALRFALASHALILCYVVTLAPLGALVWMGRPHGTTSAPRV